MSLALALDPTAAGVADVEEDEEGLGRISYGESRDGRARRGGRRGSVHTPETVITATVLVWKAVSQSEEPRSIMDWSSVMLVVV